LYKGKRIPKRQTKKGDEKLCESLNRPWLSRFKGLQYPITRKSN